MANSFTDESWKEFCNRYRLKYFSTDVDYEFSHDTYVSYETCAVVKFDSKKMKILSVYWEDSKGELHYDSFYEGTLEAAHEGLMHAVFPKKVTELFTRLVQIDFSEKFFPARDGSSTLWELLRSKIECLQNDENKKFVDKICQMISVKVDEDAEKSSSVNVDLEEFVFRQNVKGDGSYSENVLEVIEVGCTYVKLLVHDRTLDNHPIYTYRSDFWYNFDKIASLESEVMTFLLELFDNVVNEEIIEAIVENRKYEGRPCFTRYSCNGQHANIYTQHFKLFCFSCMGFTVCFSFRDLREGFIEDEKEQICAEGFYTDAFLLYALDSQVTDLSGINSLSFFCTKLREEIGKLYLLTDEISEIFSAVEENIDRVAVVLEDRIENLPKSENVKGTDEASEVNDSEAANTKGGLLGSLMDAFGVTE